MLRRSVVAVGLLSVSLLTGCNFGIPKEQKEMYYEYNKLSRAYYHSTNHKIKEGIAVNNST